MPKNRAAMSLLFSMAAEPVGPRPKANRRGE